MSKFASIHGGLLARKGEAAPAIRHSHPSVSYSDGPSIVPPIATAPPPVEVRKARPAPGSVFGDMRVPEPAEPTTCARPDLGAQGRQSCDREKSSGRGDQPAGRVSMRLTERQKRMVMIATAVLGRSQQKLLSDALDSHLAQLGARELQSCACFNGQLGRDRTPAS